MSGAIISISIGSGGFLFDAARLPQERYLLSLQQRRNLANAALRCGLRAALRAA